MPDPLIERIKGNVRFQELISKAWDIFYIEGRRPEVGVRRENFIKMAIQKELGLRLESAPSLERQVDFYVIISGRRRPYSLKTMESVGTMKVAWDSYPDVERLREAARCFEFKAPILFFHREGIYVFEVEDIERVRRELGFDGFWAIPRRDVNPRGFGIKGRALRRLMEIAREKGNFVRLTPVRLDLDKVRGAYLEGWYELIKRLVLTSDELTERPL